MGNLDLAKLYAKQISLTEWLEKIGHRDTTPMRREDNEKRERLKVLNEICGLPFDKPVQFSLSQIVDQTPEFLEYLSVNGDKLCALRLIPVDEQLPKLRMRGMTVRRVVNEWLPEQKAEANKYRADFVPHSDKSNWSTIFVVTKNGIFGEIIGGTHAQLTQGFFDGDNRPIIFSYDFKNLEMGENNDAARLHVLEIIRHLEICDISFKKILAERLNAEFFSDYLAGYFETVSSDEYGLWFCDYNRLLGAYFDGAMPKVSVCKDAINDVILRGRGVSVGNASGTVRYVPISSELEKVDFNDGDILVCEMTSPDHLPFMKLAAGIITDMGGILSHAAIVSRELKKPCVVGTQTATKRLVNGDQVTVNGDLGIVSIFRE